MPPPPLFFEIYYAVKTSVVFKVYYSVGKEYVTVRNKEKYLSQCAHIKKRIKNSVISIQSSITIDEQSTRLVFFFFSFVNHSFIVCSSFVPRSFIVRSYFVQHLFIIRSLFVHRSFIVLSLFVHRLFSIFHRLFIVRSSIVHSSLIVRSLFVHRSFGKNLNLYLLSSIKMAIQF